MTQIVQSPFRLHFGWYFAAAILATVIFLFQPWWTVDDAYISYHYAQNLVAHGQLTWNVGEQPYVEGYTGIFLPLLASLILGVGLPLLGTIKVLGIMAFGACIWLFLDFAAKLEISRKLQIVGLAAILISPLFYLHSISGLETIFFTLFVFASLHSLTATGSTSWGLRTGFWLLLLVLCRPEGYLMLAITLVIVLLYRKHVYEFRKNSLGIIILAIIPAILLLLWRQYYYGAWLPNTFYAKQYHGILSLDSVKAFLQFFVYYLLIPTGLGILSLLTYKRNQTEGMRTKLPFYVGLVFAAVLLLVYFRSNLYMNYGARFFLPLYLPFLLFGIYALNHAFDSSFLKPATRQLNLVFLGICMVCQLLILGWRFEREWYFLNYYSAIMEDELLPTANYLKENMPANATVISYMDAGAIAYYSGLKIIDFGRLNNRYLTQQSLSDQEIADYFFGLNADAAVFTSETENSYSYIPEAEMIVADPRFRNYKIAHQWSNRLNYPYFQRLYIRQQ